MLLYLKITASNNMCGYKCTTFLSQKLSLFTVTKLQLNLLVLNWRLVSEDEAKLRCVKVGHFFGTPCNISLAVSGCARLNQHGSVPWWRWRHSWQIERPHHSNAHGCWTGTTRIISTLFIQLLEFSFCLIYCTNVNYWRQDRVSSVSYTHLTLPTNREV